MLLTASYRRPRRIELPHRRPSGAPGRHERATWATRCRTTCSPAPACASRSPSPSSIPSIGPALATLLSRREVPPVDRSRGSTPCTSCCRRRSPGCSAPASACSGLQRTRSSGPGPERPRHRRHADGAGLRAADHRLPPHGRRRLHACSPPSRRSTRLALRPLPAWDATTAAQPGLVHGLAGGRRVRRDARWDLQIGGLIPAILLAGGRPARTHFHALFLVPWIHWVATRDGAFHNVLMLRVSIRAQRLTGRIRRVPDRAARGRRQRRVRLRLALVAAGVPGGPAVPVLPAAAAAASSPTRCCAAGPRGGRSPFAEQRSRRGRSVGPRRLRLECAQHVLPAFCADAPRLATPPQRGGHAPPGRRHAKGYTARPPPAKPRWSRGRWQPPTTRPTTRMCHWTCRRVRERAAQACPSGSPIGVASGSGSVRSDRCGAVQGGRRRIRRGQAS